MITKEIAMTHPAEMWHNTYTNADGTPLRVRSNGACKTWKTRPDEFSLPVKQGMYASDRINNFTAHEWSLPDHWPIERHWGKPE